MTYTISDLHGYPLEKFKKLLAKAGFGEDDYLYILGDVIDRNGDGGIEMLQWLMYQYNIQMLLGNHEAALLSCAFLFEEVTEESIAAMDTEKMQLFAEWTANGGDITVRELGKLNKEGTTIMMVTHDARVAAKCSRVMFIVDGEIRGEKELGILNEDSNIRERERSLNNWLIEMGW